MAYNGSNNRIPGGYGPPPRSAIQEESSSSEEDSSDWDDWQDADYIEE